MTDRPNLLQQKGKPNFGTLCDQIDAPPSSPGRLRPVFDESMADNWQPKWFLDGKEATLEHRDNGLYFAAFEERMTKHVKKCTVVLNPEGKRPVDLIANQRIGHNM